jgi:pre-rRNA-processing protein TSR3
VITIILRHARENLKKCSLKGLEKRSDFRFFTYPKDLLPEMPDYILLKNIRIFINLLVFII